MCDVLRAAWLITSRILSIEQFAWQPRRLCTAEIIDRCKLGMRKSKD